MTKKLPKKNSFFLAPMEGVTDATYRKVMMKIYPAWDYMFTDFLRFPSVGRFSAKHFIRHFGEEIYNDKTLRAKTVFQVMAAPHSNNIDSIKQIEELEFPWVDLNVGCPSKQVNGSCGGAYLLDHPEDLKKIIFTLRKNYSGFLSAKIRVGVSNDHSFENILKLLEGEGIDLITVHGRTKEQLYKGKSNWDYIRRAAQVCNIPIIGNGDIWTIKDIKNFKQHTNSYGIMLGRSALKTPWIVEDYKKFKEHSDKVSENYLLRQRSRQIPHYFQNLFFEMSKDNIESKKIHMKFKGLSRYIFEDFSNHLSLKSEILRGQTLEQFFKLIHIH